MKAWELLNGPDKWCQRTECLDKNGNSTSCHSETAYCFCLVGALAKCYGTFGLDSESSKKAKLIQNRTKVDIAVWNDRDSTTYEQVHALLKELDI